MTNPRTQSKRKSRIRKKPRKKSTISFMRILAVAGLAIFLVFSVCTVGYVIFFRTVFAQEVLPRIKEAIVFEEPDPPVQNVEKIDKNQISHDQRPKVAIIIDDMGYNEALGLRFIEFPLPITYSFLPFAPFTGKQERMVYDSGKTVFLHLPLEPKSKRWDPGPGTMFLSDTDEIAKEKFEKSLSAVPHAVGVNNHMGSLFTTDEDAMKHLIEMVKSKGLFFVDSFTTSGSKGLKTAKEFGVVSARRNVFLDNELDENKICKQIEQLVNIAEKIGSSIGIGHPHIETFNALTMCTRGYKDTIEFVSVTDILR